MTTPTSLSSRLDSVSDQHKTTIQLIQRLSKLSFQPGSTPLDFADGEGDIRVELSSEIHENLKQQEEELELLKQEVEEVTSTSSASKRRRESERDRDWNRLSIQVVRLGEDLKNARSQFRRAQLSAKKSAEAARLKERELLFSSVREGNNTFVSGRRRGQDKLSQEELEVNASSDVTAALRRTHNLLSNELTRSRFAQETLEQSQEALKDLGEKYSSLDDLLSASKNLVSTLVRSQKSDSWYLEAAFFCLVATIIWLIFRRILYGPLAWAIWPAKLLIFYSFRFLFSAAFGGSATTSLVAPSIATPSPIRSATGEPPRIPQAQQGWGRPVKVGGGGRGAPVDFDPNPPGSLSQKVGKMTEESQRKAKEGMSEGEEKKEQVVRGDGTVLEDRPSDKPVNRKKKMFDTADEAKREGKDKDEL